VTGTPVPAARPAERLTVAAHCGRAPPISPGGDVLDRCQVSAERGGEVRALAMAAWMAAARTSCQMCEIGCREPGSGCQITWLAVSGRAVIN
jgi:hypothetical protein